MKEITLLFLFFCSVTSFTQEVDSTKLKQIEMIKKIMYGMNSELFKKQDYYSKLDTEYEFPWKYKKYTSEQLKNALDTLAKNSKILITDGRFSNSILELDSYFPTYIKDEVSNIFELTIESNLIKNESGEIVEVEKDGNTGFGSKFSSGYKNGKSYSYDWKTVNKTFNIRSNNTNEELEGQILFNASFILDYNFVKITKSSIGKSLNIGDLRFRVIDFFDNKVILHFEEDIENLKFSFANIDSKGSRISQIPLFNFANLKEKDSKIPSNAVSLPEGSQSIYKVNYDLFKSKPTLSFDEYKKYTHQKFQDILNSDNQKEMVRKVWGTKYLMFTATDELQNFFLYLPNNLIEKEFELTLD